LIYQISKSNQIQLITGWTGSRKWKSFYKKKKE
jgi:hypothetical protein